MTEQFLPLVASVPEKKDQSATLEYIFEPSKEEIINN